ncbi:MAG: bifunctional hydroxymethylpyrimidine kinase/phosphomethylpyrimidine kinase [Acidilobaceae archaeon]
MVARPWRVAITIAGSDSGGGAGIQADLKTFAALGVHGTVAITSITAQNTYQVTAIHDLPPEMVYEQIKVVAEDMGIDAGKTGMLSNKEIISAVARAVDDYPFPLVVDPVMVAKSGARLLREDAVEALKRELLPRAKVATPNRWEAEILSGIRIESLDDAKKAAEVIAEEYGCEAVVAKGGHLSVESSPDVLYWRGRHYVIPGPRIERACTHGTGCSFSAAIAAYLARGFSVYEAVVEAKKFITIAIEYGVRVGKGYCPVNPTAWLELPALRYEALRSVEMALGRALSIASELRLDSEIEIAESIPARYARSSSDVAVALIKPREGAVGPALGSSTHTAETLHSLMAIDAETRAMVTMRYDERLVERALDKGYTVACIELPKEATTRELAREAAKIAGGRLPDIICEGVRGEAFGVLRIVARNALEAVEKLADITSTRVEDRKNTKTAIEQENLKAEGP